MFAASLRRMFGHPAAAGVLLFVAALAAIVMANTGASALYDAIIHFPARSGGETSAHLTVQLLVNDGLMAVFFLAVGLEVKYELLQSALNSRARAAFPDIAALEGMAAPARRLGDSGRHRYRLRLRLRRRRAGLAGNPGADQPESVSAGAGDY